jgi:type IV pilus assembly protein PilQ
MIGTLKSRSNCLIRPGVTAPAAALIACALVTIGVSARPAVAQSSNLRAAFNDTTTNNSAPSEPWPGAVRLAAAQQPAAAKSAKPPTPPPARKSPPAKRVAPTLTPEKQSPVVMEELPVGPMKAVLPLAGGTPGEGLVLTQDEKDKGIIKALIVRDKPLSQVLSVLAQSQHLNIVASNDIDVMISITLKNVPVEDALTAVLAVANYTWVKRGNIILITSVADSVNLPADVQGRQIQVFDLDFASAANISETVQNFLSPIGKSSISVSNHANNRMTQERIIVEDLPESLSRIADYIAQVDRPPRQVLIEAHVLQVTLDDTTKCGVNLDQLMRIGGSNLKLTTTGFANPDSEQAFLATLDGGDVGGVIEAIQTTTDAKTLGSPKILVLNEQEARLQVGEHLGFKVSTTTETSTIQNVQFLDVGVVLRLTPRITRDSCVLLHVRPEVSKGSVNPETGLPESQTAELETDVMLADGQGMVIGGLIKENDSVQQSKVPWLGNVRGVGWLFRRTEATKERVEIIVALVPRVQPYDAKYQAFEQGEVVKASVPLMHGPLCRTDRPWDPILPDGKRIKYPLIPPRNRPPKTGYYHDEMPDYVIPPDPLPEQHFYSDGQECEPADPQTTGPIMPDQELPLPEVNGDYSGSSHIISDQPIALKESSKRTSGAKK